MSISVGRALVPVCAIGIFTMTGQVSAQDIARAGANGYPAKPVRMIVPLAPGGGSDIVARILAAALGGHWGQSVVVDNRPGAGSVIGTGIAARAPRDGHTLLVSSSSIAITPALYKSLDFHIARDFDGISLIASQPSILAVHPSVAASSVQELVSLLKSQPGQYRYGSAGRGSASHLANELFRVAAGVEVTHVPYKSAGLAATALLSGEVQFMVTNMATALPQVKAGKMKALGVTSAQRTAMAPDLPTLADEGLSGFEYTTWYGMLAPAGTPKAVISKIHRDAAAFLRVPAVQERFSSQGLELHVSTPEDFRDHLRHEISKWDKVVRSAGVKAE